MLLIQIHCDHIKVNRRALTQFEQHIQQTVAVLTAGQADHHFVAILDHIVVTDGLTNQPRQAFFEFVVFVFLLLFVHIFCFLEIPRPDANRVTIAVNIGFRTGDVHADDCFFGQNLLRDFIAQRFL